jgi:hypothetical protein
MQNSGRGNGPGAHIDGFLNSSNRTEFSFDDMGDEPNFSMGESEGVEFEFNESSFEATFDSRFGEARSTRTPVETDPRATKLMEDAMEGIKRTYETYVGFAGSDATLLDVDASIDSFDGPKIRRLAQEARASLEKATEYAPEGQKNIILSLVQVTIFLEELSRLREALRDAYGEFDYAVERLYAESTLRAKRTAIRMNEARSEAQSLFEPLRKEIDPEAVSVYTPIGNVYEEKIRQLRAEIDAFRNFNSAVKSAANGIDEFKTGVPRFYRREYEKALSPLRTAQFRFESARSSLAIVDESTGIQEKALEVEGVMSALRGAADGLHRAAEVKVDDDPQPQFFEARRAAESAVGDNDIAAEMRTASQIIT